jgi:hypothetical protein
MSAWLTENRKPGIDSVMRIAGLYDIDPRLLSGDQLAFAKELADPGPDSSRLRRTSGMSQLESVRSAHCGGTRTYARTRTGVTLLCHGPGGGSRSASQREGECHVWAEPILLVRRPV